MAIAAASGCTLVDRQTFAADPVAPDLSAAATARMPSEPGAVPLITVRFAVASPDFAQAIGGAVRAVEARRGGRYYRVVLVTPSVATPALKTGARDALAVARAIIAAGVIAPRVSLAGEVDRALPAREIRVFAGPAG